MRKLVIEEILQQFKSEYYELGFEFIYYRQTGKYQELDEHTWSIEKVAREINKLSDKDLLEVLRNQHCQRFR